MKEENKQGAYGVLHEGGTMPKDPKVKTPETDITDHINRASVNIYEFLKGAKATVNHYAGKIFGR